MEDMIIKILTIAIGGLTFISVLISLIKTAIHKKNTTNSEELNATIDLLAEDNNAKSSTIKGLEGANELVKTIIPQAIELAEKSGIIGAEAKLTLALSKIALGCIEEGIDYNANKDFIKETIEKLINFSKEVNH